MTGLVEKRSYWLHSGTAELATHAHLPLQKPASRAVLLCGTVGFEAIHAYRCMVRLGDALAAAGIAAFRFDYAGTGNSSGDADDTELVPAWRQNIIDQARDLEERWDFTDVTVVGFRLGTALLSSALNELDISGVAFWEPVTRGKSFVREIRAVSQFAADATPDSCDRMESGGFVFAADTISAIASLSTQSHAVPAHVPVLLLSRGKNPALSPATFADRNPFEEVRNREYERMICEPHYTELPTESIACMVHWHASIDADQPTENPTPESLRSATITRSSDHTAVKDSMFRTTDGDLFGIVSQPPDYVAGSKPTVVLSNAGSVCSIGPNRIYVQTARALVAAGLEVVRFDLRNIGDSVTGDVHDANAPYPDTAEDDIGRILAHCRESYGATAFILAGLCSGSHASYHYALASDERDLQEIILINPLTYYYNKSMSLDNPKEHRTLRHAKSYVRSARQPANWRRLFAGQINYRRLARFSMRVFRGLVRNSAQKISSLWARRSLSQMDTDLIHLHQRGLQVSYVFSDTDPGYWIARADSPNTFRNLVRCGDSTVMFISNADHTMSTTQNRKDLIAALGDHLLSTTNT